jgi:hypothetical protein
MKAATPFLALVIALVACPIGFAQASAGSTGLCKDGTYTTAATKSGACAGHKGVKEWYAASKDANAPTEAKGAKASKETKSSKTAATDTTPAAAPAPATAPAPAASTAAARPATASPVVPAHAPRAKADTAVAAPGGGNGQVWLNTASNVYHCPGSHYYGKTKAGAYMSESEAKSKGGRPDQGKPCK